MTSGTLNSTSSLLQATADGQTHNDVSNPRPPRTSTSSHDQSRRVERIEVASIERIRQGYFRGRYEGRHRSTVIQSSGDVVFEVS